ncbi:regulatory protein RecX [Microbacterium sp. NM3R9]|nr:regulatory protein RecX [Microbacterium thalli]MDN8548389.1 regulatory protein RecX [Microbacterium thalli]
MSLRPTSAPRNGDVAGPGDRDGSGDGDDDRRDRAERMLLRKLRTRSLSIREARTALRDAEVDGDVAEQVIAAFEQNGYLDDARLAEQLLDGALGRKAQGATAIAQTLSRRGLDREVIDIALASLPDDEAERAEEFARQRARGMSGLDRDVALRRLHGQLARRGFSGTVARDAARRALDEAAD